MFKQMQRSIFIYNPDRFWRNWFDWGPLLVLPHLLILFLIIGVPDFWLIHASGVGTLAWLVFYLYRRMYLMRNDYCFLRNTDVRFRLLSKQYDLKYTEISEVTFLENELTIICTEPARNLVLHTHNYKAKDLQRIQEQLNDKLGRIPQQSVSS